MGVYVFKKSVLFASTRAICSSGAGFDFGHDIIPILIGSARTYAYDFRDKERSEPRYWRDIGTIDAYYTTSMDLVEADAPFDPKASESSPSQRTLHPYSDQAHNTAKDSPRLHGSARIRRTVLSPGVQVEADAVVDDSVLMPGVRLGKGAHLRRAIVEEGVQIPSGFRAGFDAESDRNHYTVSESGVLVISHELKKTKSTALHFAVSSLDRPGKANQLRVNQLTAFASEFELNVCATKNVELEGSPSISND
jgi:glucose-1-phosphate adenylyltransferase